MYDCVDFLVAVTIYVKKEEEKVYNALMLDSLTVGDMVEAVSCFSSFCHRMLHCVNWFLCIETSPATLCWDQGVIDLVILFQVASKYGMPPEMIKNV